MPFGYNKRIVRVNLTNSEISIEHPDENFYRRYLGGQGFVAYFLLKELLPSIDPLGDENKLVFAAGPVTGTPIAGSGRNSVGAKSPLTGGFGESEVGGHWGAELKHAGFDAIIIEGKADSPVYLWVHDKEVEIRKADNLWGKDTGEAEKIIRKDLSDNLVRVALIGIGGERMVRYANVMNDLKDAAGRTGMGAVMGSKNLKAIAVRGHQKLDLAEPNVLRDLNRWLLENLDSLVGWAHKYGTGSALDVGIEMGNLPIKNFREGVFPNAMALDARTMKETIRIGMEGCYACPVRCKKIVKIGEPWNVDPCYGGPEYESLAALGSNCGVDNLYAVSKANELCNKHSVDTMSAGCAVAFAMECYEKGIITDKETDGVKLHFGNADAMVQMVEMICERRGIGNLLAEGVKRAAAKIGKGSEKYAMHVKGQELPMHEPRVKLALSLGYAVSPTGADHMHSLHGWEVAARSDKMASIGILEPLPYEDLGPSKIRAMIYYVNGAVLDNCLVMCDFLPWDYVQTTNIVRAVTGWQTSTWDLMKLGERVINMARVFNCREGFVKEDDWLPDRFFNPTSSGPLSETSVNPLVLDNARTTYYEMMGWDENGVPKKAKLEELDIGWTSRWIT